MPLFWWSSWFFSGPLTTQVSLHAGGLLIDVCSHSEISFAWFVCCLVERVVCFKCPTSIRFASLLSVRTPQVLYRNCPLPLDTHWRIFYLGGMACPLLAMRTTKGITFYSSESGSLCSFTFNLQVPFSKLLCAWVCQICNQWSLLRAEYQSVLFTVYFILFNILPVLTPVDSCSDSGNSIGALPVSYPQITVTCGPLWSLLPLLFSARFGWSKSKYP